MKLLKFIVMQHDFFIVIKNCYLILLLFLILGCKKTNDTEPETFKGPYIIANGCYQGYFYFKDKSLWCDICFDTTNYKYEEWPSGGIMYQKDMGCLTVGTYSIDSFRLTFTLDSIKHKFFPCFLPESVLPGEYKITNIVGRDSVIFEKGTGDNRIIYKMKRVWP